MQKLFVFFGNKHPYQIFFYNSDARIYRGPPPRAILLYEPDSGGLTVSELQEAGGRTFAAHEMRGITQIAASSLSPLIYLVGDGAFFTCNIRGATDLQLDIEMISSPYVFLDYVFAQVAIMYQYYDSHALFGLTNDGKLLMYKEQSDAICRPENWVCLNRKFNLNFTIAGLRASYFAVAVFDESNACVFAANNNVDEWGKNDYMEDLLKTDLMLERKITGVDIEDLRIVNNDEIQDNDYALGFGKTDIEKIWILSKNGDVLFFNGVDRKHYAEKQKYADFYEG